MAVQSVKSIISGVVATFVGGVLFIWFFDLGPFAKSTPASEENSLERTSQSSRNFTFSFHSPELKFYEADKEGLVRDQRIYQDTFAADEARFIFWELVIKHNELPQDSDINFLVIYREPGGGEKARLNYEATSLAGWSSSAYTWGWGKSEPGTWLPGEHKLELHYQGNLLASKPFFIR